MSVEHEPLQALGPVPWDDVSQSSLREFLENVFGQALTVVESVPSPTSEPAASPTTRSRAKTESAINSPHLQRLQALDVSQASISAAQRLRKDWKEIKVNAKDNPLGINVFKLAAKDGKGSWFARQSIHQDLSFDHWKLGLQKEFAETMKVQGSPGSGSIRGIGADKSVVHHVVDAVGEIDGEFFFWVFGNTDSHFGLG